MSGRKLLFVLALLAAAISSDAQQPTTTLFGSGAPGGSVAFKVGTEYIDQSQTPAVLYVCTSVSVAAGPTPPAGTQMCNWTQAGSGTTAGSSSVAGIYAGAAPYNAMFNGRSSTDGVLNSTTTVTSATLSCTNADVGKLIFTVNASSLAKANSTVASCSGASFIMNAAATATESGDNLVICSDDTTALTNAFNAAFAASVPLYLPAGLSCISNLPFLIPAVPSPTPPPNQAMIVKGAGLATSVLGMTPSFSFASVTTGGATVFENLWGNSCQYSNTTQPIHLFNVVTAEDFSVTGFNFGFPSWPAATGVFYDVCQSRRLGVWNIHNANVVGYIIPQTESTLADSQAQGLGSTSSNGIGVSTGPGGNSPSSITIFNNIIAFTGTGLLMNGCQGCQVIGQLYTQNNIDISLTNSSTVQIADVGITATGNGQTGLKVDGTSIANLGRVLLTGGNTGAVGIQVLSGGKVRLEQIDYVVLAGTPTEINNAGTIFDGCNNVFTASQITNTGNWAGNNCSVTGTALTAGAIVPSANWGTSAAVSAPFGNTTDISFTLTNGTAAVGANPTLTYTFPTPFPSGRPNLCSIYQTGGTQAQISGEWSVGTPTSTSVVFTYNGTPTINLTEFISVECR